MTETPLPWEKAMENLAGEMLPAVQLFLGDRPRLEIPLAPATAGALPAWISVGLPGPLAPHRPEGRFVADPRLPELEVVLRWGQAPAIHRELSVLTVSVGDWSRTLEQDVRHPQRWLVQADPDHRRHWS
jgi:hypothetical protein